MASNRNIYGIEYVIIAKDSSGHTYYHGYSFATEAEAMKWLHEKNWGYTDSDGNKWKLGFMPDYSNCSPVYWRLRHAVEESRLMSR